MNSATLPERVLVLLLRVGGVVTISAFLTMVMPTSAMKAVHRWLGMGELPAAPVVDYLARSVSALYGFHGALLLLISCDVRRYRPLVTFVGVMNVCFGTALIGIDLHAGMPGAWTVGEGPVLIVWGAVILSLNRAVPARYAERHR